MKIMKSSHRYHRSLILTCCIAILLLTISGHMGRKLSVLKNIAPAASAQEDKAQRKALSSEERRDPRKFAYAMCENGLMSFQSSKTTSISSGIRSF